MGLNWKSHEVRWRFREVLSLLCGGIYPRKEIVDAWIDSDNEDLQSWCVNNAGLTYLAGISVLEAAVLLVEGAFDNANIDSEGNIK